MSNTLRRIVEDKYSEFRSWMLSRNLDNPSKEDVDVMLSKIDELIDLLSDLRRNMGVDEK